MDYARAVYGVLTMPGTLTHQPDYKTDFPAYARYITTRTLLAATSWRASAVRGSDSSPGRALGADRGRPVESVELNLSGMESSPDLDSERAHGDDRL